MDNFLALSVLFFIIILKSASLLSEIRIELLFNHCSYIVISGRLVDITTIAGSLNLYELFGRLLRLLLCSLSLAHMAKLTPPSSKSCLFSLIQLIVFRMTYLHLTLECWGISPINPLILPLILPLAVENLRTIEGRHSFLDKFLLVSGIAGKLHEPDRMIFLSLNLSAVMTR